MRNCKNVPCVHTYTLVSVGVHTGVAVLVGYIPELLEDGATKRHIAINRRYDIVPCQSQYNQPAIEVFVESVCVRILSAICIGFQQFQLSAPARNPRCYTHQQSPRAAHAADFLQCFMLNLHQL